MGQRNIKSSQLEKVDAKVYAISRIDHNEPWEELMAGLSIDLVHGTTDKFLKNKDVQVDDSSKANIIFNISA